MKLLSVNIGGAGAPHRRPVEGDIAVGPLGLEGDAAGDSRARTLYAYPAEHHAVWRTLRAQAGAAGWDAPLPFGAFGEQLSIEGLLESRAYVGDLLRFARCALAVSEPRLPSDSLNAALGFAHAAKMMRQSRACGFYLAVRQPGLIRAGEAFELVPGPREVSIDELFRARTKT